MMTNASGPGSLSEKMIAMEGDLARHGIKLETFCCEARIACSTWWRWKTGHMSPTVANWGEVCDVYAAMINARDGS